VTINRPGIGVVEAFHQMSSPWRRRRPQPEGAVHVHPGSRFMGTPANILRRIEGSGVHVPGLNADERSIIQRW